MPRLAAREPSGRRHCAHASMCSVSGLWMSARGDSEKMGLPRGIGREANRLRPHGVSRTSTAAWGQEK